ARAATGTASLGVPSAHRSRADRPLASPRRHDQPRRAAGRRRLPGDADLRRPGRPGQDDRPQRHLPGPLPPVGARRARRRGRRVRDRRPCAGRPHDDHHRTAGPRGMHGAARRPRGRAGRCGPGGQRARLAHGAGQAGRARRGGAGV
ncbi:MAG: Ligand-binding SRPBCC domain protein family, partial [uncultured Blastococcus sp.]